MNAAPTDQVLVDIVSSDVTATANDDYQPVAATITFNPGDIYPKNTPVTVTINGDTDSEPDETLTLTLDIQTADEAFANEGTNQTTITILNDDFAPLIINEIMYNDPGVDDEWIEIYNNSASPIDISNYEVDVDGTTEFTFPASTTIPANGFLTIALGSDGDGTFNEGNPFTPDFTSVGTPATVASTSSTNTLNNTDGIITLMDGTTTIDEVSYDDGPNFPTAADGSGPSLELDDPSLDNNDGSNWMAITAGGTPGAANAILPVQLLSFSAISVQSSIALTWTTAQEQNNDYFQVQRSTDTREWTTIGQVAGNGTTEVESNYEFLDREPATGVNYYRLQQFDYDGASEIHRTISVRNETATGPVSVFPNPVQEELTIRSHSAATVVVTDRLGRIVSSVRFDATETPFQMDTREWAIGTYFVSVRTVDGVNTTKIVKQ